MTLPLPPRAVHSISEFVSTPVQGSISKNKRKRSIQNYPTIRLHEEVTPNLTKIKNKHSHSHTALPHYPPSPLPPPLPLPSSSTYSSSAQIEPVLLRRTNSIDRASFRPQAGKSDHVTPQIKSLSPQCQHGGSREKNNATLSRQMSTPLSVRRQGSISSAQGNFQKQRVQNKSNSGKAEFTPNVHPQRSALTSIVTEYLRFQHHQCKYPISVPPCFSLRRPHMCPAPLSPVMDALSIINNRSIISKCSPYGTLNQLRHIIYTRYR